MEINPAMMGRPALPEQNLIKPVKLPDSRPPGFWKSIGLDFISLLSALALGFGYFEFLTVGLSPWYVFSAALIFATCTVLQVFLAPNLWRRVFVLLGESILLVIWFAFYDPWQVVVAVVGLSFLVLFWGYMSARSDAANNLEVAFFGTSRQVLGKLMTALLLMMILLYAPQAEGRGIFLPRSSFRTLYNWAANFLDGFYPNLSLGDSFGNFSQNLVRLELQNNPTFISSTPSAQKAAVEQAVTQLSGTVNSATGVRVTSSTPLGDVAYDYIVATLGTWKDKFQNQFMLAWILIAFVLLRTAGVVFIWIAQFVALVIYELLLSLGFMFITESTQTKEVVEY